jgi:hypothetical protein
VAEAVAAIIASMACAKGLRPNLGGVLPLYVVIRPETITTYCEILKVVDILSPGLAMA